MCTSCGCLLPANDHGQPKAHITVKRLRKSASAAGLPLMEAAWNIPRTLCAAQGPWPPEDDPLADRPAIMFDVDGILAFTAEALCTSLNARFGTTYSPLSQEFFPGALVASRLPPEQAQWVSGQFGDEVFLGGLAPDFHAMDVLRDAHDAGYDCSVVTERPPEMEYVTGRWLGDWGGPLVPVRAVGHGNKPVFLGAEYGPGDPAVLVDDNPAAMLTVARDSIQVWAPERYYTEGPDRAHVRRFATWDVVRYWLGLGPQP